MGEQMRRRAAELWTCVWDTHKGEWGDVDNSGLSESYLFFRDCLLGENHYGGLISVPMIPSESLESGRFLHLDCLTAERNFSLLLILPLFADIKGRHADQTHASVSLLHLWPAKNHLNIVWQPTHPPVCVGVASLNGLQLNPEQQGCFPSLPPAELTLREADLILHPPPVTTNLSFPPLSPGAVFCNVSYIFQLFCLNKIKKKIIKKITFRDAS